MLTVYIDLYWWACKSQWRTLTSPPYITTNTTKKGTFLTQPQAFLNWKFQCCNSSIHDHSLQVCNNTHYTYSTSDILTRLKYTSTRRTVAGSTPDEGIGFFNWPNTSSRTTALGLTQPLTEMSARNLPGNKERPAREADNLIAICEPIV
jgi:hypothetical protein